MLAIICLVTIGTAIVVGRLYLNGEREVRAAQAQASAMAAAPVRQRRRRAATPEPAAQASAPSPPERWPGGSCPRCRAETVPGGKFCGECGNRLVAG